MTMSQRHIKSALETSVNLEAKNIVEPINLNDRIECIARTPAFITLKDHKRDFRQNPKLAN